MTRWKGISLMRSREVMRLYPTGTCSFSQGKIQLDDRWTHLDDMGEYQLMSSDTVSHAYLIADDQLEQLVWMNLWAGSEIQCKIWTNAGENRL